MGEIAEATLSGLFCEWCGEVIGALDDGLGEEPGFPRLCPGCEHEKELKSKSNLP